MGFFEDGSLLLCLKAFLEECFQMFFGNGFLLASRWVKAWMLLGSFLNLLLHFDFDPLSLTRKSHLYSFCLLGLPCCLPLSSPLLWFSWCLSQRLDNYTRLLWPPPIDKRFTIGWFFIGDDSLSMTLFLRSLKFGHFPDHKRWIQLEMCPQLHKTNDSEWNHKGGPQPKTTPQKV